MYDELPVIPDSHGIGAKYGYLFAGSRIAGWVLSQYCSDFLTASLLNSWSILLSTGPVYYCCIRIIENPKYLWSGMSIVSQVRSETFVFRKRNPESAGGTKVLLGCHRCRIAVDTGITEKLNGF